MRSVNPNVWILWSPIITQSSETQESIQHVVGDFRCVSQRQTKTYQDKKIALENNSHREYMPQLWAIRLLAAPLSSHVHLYPELLLLPLESRLKWKSTGWETIKKLFPVWVSHEAQNCSRTLPALGLWSSEFEKHGQQQIRENQIKLVHIYQTSSPAGLHHLHSWKGHQCLCHTTVSMTDVCW